MNIIICKHFKNSLKGTCFLIVLVLVFLSCSSNQNNKENEVQKEIDDVANSSTPNATSIIDSMDVGFNLGNTFDNSIQSTDPEVIKPIIDLYHSAGMKHIRIPVTWMDGFEENTLADSSGSIDFDHPRFVQLKTVIDYALNKGLYVVINAHHEHWLKNHYDGTAKFDDPFSNLWKNIATYFIDYPHKLIFEVLNEPSGMMGQSHGDFPSPQDSTAIALTRQINKVGYDAIRETGGLNTTRTIMIAPNRMGNQSMIDEVYPTKSVLPGKGNDPFLSIQVHTYDPWSFCGQDGSNEEYPGQQVIIDSIMAVANHAELLEVPINYGEFGVGRRSNSEERNTDIVKEFYITVTQTTLSENMSCTVWDDQGWFGLVTRDESNNLEFTFGIVPIMLE